MKRLFLCLLALWCMSCDNTLGPPEDVLSERKMVSILVELQVAEAKVKNLRVHADSARQLYHLYELQILDNHNVSQDKYVYSYQYYLDNHRLMTRVHEAVLDTLQRRQQKWEKLPDEPEPAVAADSLTRLPLRKDSLLQQRLQRIRKQDSII